MLTVREHTALHLADRLSRRGRGRVQVLAEIGWSETRLWQVVHVLLERPDVQAAEPALVRRLRRLRDARAAARSSRRVA